MSVTSTFHRQQKIPVKVQVTLLFYKGNLILTQNNYGAKINPRASSGAKLPWPWKHITVLMHSMEPEIVLALATQLKLEKKETRPAVLKEEVHCWPTK